MGATAEDLKAQLEVQRTDLTRDVQAIGDRVTPGRIVERQRAQARRSIHDLRDKVMGTTHAAQSSAGQTASHASSAISDAGSSVAETAAGVRDQIAGLPGQAISQTQGAPLIAGAVAFGIGALLGAVIAPTRKEQELVQRHEGEIQELATQVKAEVSEVAAQAKDHLVPEMKDAAAELSSQAKEIVADVKEQVTTATADVGEQATAAVNDVKDSAS